MTKYWILSFARSFMYSVPHYILHICGPWLIANSLHFSPTFEDGQLRKNWKWCSSWSTGNPVSTSGNLGRIFVEYLEYSILCGSYYRIGMFFLNSVTRCVKILTFGHFSEFSFGDWGLTPHFHYPWNTGNETPQIPPTPSKQTTYFLYCSVLFEKGEC